MTGMTGRRAAEAGLLEPAIGYALDAIQAVTPDLMSRATPCRSSIRRSQSPHGVGRDRSSGVTARTTLSA